MKKKFGMVLGWLLVFGWSAAQLKTITLEESVLQQNRKFGADRMTGFQWIPGSTDYVYYTTMWTKMMQASATRTEAKEGITLAELNAALGTKITNFFGLQWIDNSHILVTENGKYYQYNRQTKSGKLLFSLPEEAENTTPDAAKQKIAYTKGNNLYVHTGSQDVAVTQESSPGIVSGQSVSRNEFGISGGIFWSPKSTFLAFYQKDETQVADYPLLDMTQTPGKLMPIKYPMAGQASEQVRVGIYHLASGKTVFIRPKSGGLNDYMTNLSWTPDEKYILVAELNRGQNTMHLNLYEATTGSFVRTLLQETHERWVEPEHEAFFPSAQSSNFIWFSERDGFQNLYYYDLNGKLIQQLTRNKFPTREIIGANPEGTVVYFKATGEQGINMLLYKVTLKGKQTLVSTTLGVHNGVLSPDGQWLFDEYSNATTPSQSVLWNAKGKATVVMTSSNKYEGYALGSAEIKTIKAADGVTDLFTRLIKPSNFDPTKKYPVLVYVYGGPHAQMITNSYLLGANLWMYWMAEQGYLVFTVDNRGSDNRGFAFESVIHRNLGNHEMADQLNGIAYLKSLPYVDANRLAVHGWSYGGFMTTSLLLRHPDVFKVGVAGGPVIDWKWYEVMYGERYMDTPEENPEGYATANVSQYAKNLTGKLLLIHGTSDDVVVEQHNLALVKKLVEAGKQADYFPYPMHKHNVTGKDRVHLMKKVLDYVIENNR